MNTYEFCADWVTQRTTGSSRVLDYGCGAGQLVELLRARGVQAYGCDVFYEGGDYSRDVAESARPYVLRMQGDRIPFDDGTFDVVVSGLVLEHVPDMDRVLGEMARVLAPGGVSLNLFPDRGVWREGHCGLPFLHRFPKGSIARVYYAALMHVLGFGLHRGAKPAMEWARDFCTWLDLWTYYRPGDEIHEIFSKHFRSTIHSEELWFRARMGGRLSFLPEALQRFVVRKFAGLALVSSAPRTA